MSEKFVRVYKKLDVSQIKPHLMIYGDLGATCAACGELDIKLEKINCPNCNTDFRYIAFRNVKSHFPKMYKITEDRPQLIFIDYEDYQKNVGVSKAEDFFK